MRNITFLACILLLICALETAAATTRYVDGSVSNSGDGLSWETAFKKIQEGINAATAGDTVSVAQGTYVENIQFKGKNIVLTSTDPLNPSTVAGTIIDGNRSRPVVTFSGKENEMCVLSGFTIRNGKAVEYGGGICGGTWDNPTHATIENNTITGNGGGGVGCCNGLIRNNMISGNSWCGLILCDGRIQNNTISGNSGSGLNDCNGTIQNNTIRGNSPLSGLVLPHNCR